uniref:Uncharacterized protein n=1 Tax=Glossina palpalis gambiensis TaxID=67801 RepID=A0A1B0BQ10_9MUSC
MIASLLLRNIFLRFESLLKLQSTRTSTTSKTLFKKYERMHKKEIFVFESPFQLMKFELSKLSNADSRNNTIDFQHSLFVESFLELTGHHFVYTSSFSRARKGNYITF